MSNPLNVIQKPYLMLLGNRNSGAIDPERDFTICQCLAGDDL